MKDKNLSQHIWRAIGMQAKAVTHSLDKCIFAGKGVETVNEIELKRLRILIRQLEEESPN